MREPQEIQDEAHEQVAERVAAVDVAKASGMVCTRVPHPSQPGRRLTKVWEVAATTGAIIELGDHLAGLGVELVTLESTSDYWRGFFYLLEAAGLEVQLVNARDVKNVPGRPKTDKLDAVWLAKLTERGMLRPSFVPPAEIRQLRDYTRLRIDLTRDRSRHVQRLEKLLEDALIKLSTVATDIIGKSGRAMLEALISGQRDPKVLAGLARGRMKAKHAALVQALTGRFDDHHAELARLLLDQYDALTAQIDRLTARIQELLAAIPAAQGVDADGTTGPDAGTGPDAAVLPAVARLDAVPGIGVKAAQVLLAELGLDMGIFPTPAHLVSWAKLCPRTIQSGTKHRAGTTGKGNPYLKGILGEIAAAAAKTDTFLGERYRAHRQAPRQAQGPGRHRPLHPGDRLAPARRPHCPLPRPWRRLLRQPHRHGPQGPQPHPPTGSPRLHRHPRPRSLTRPAPPHPATQEPASPAAAACPAQVAIFGSVLMSRAGTPRRRENRGGLPADAGAFLVVEAVESVWRRGLDLDGSRTVLGARRSDFRFPDRGPRAALCVWPTVKVRRRSGDAGAAGDPRRSARAGRRAGGRGRCGQGQRHGLHAGAAPLPAGQAPHQSVGGGGDHRRDHRTRRSPGGPGGRPGHARVDLG